MLLLFRLIVFVILILPDNVKGAENDVFVQAGGDLLLNVTTLKKFDLFYWQFNSKETLVAFDSSGKPTVEKNYTGRIELFGDERSVKLKNLQKSDSGVYAAIGSGVRWELLEKYNVTVKGSENQGVAVLAVVFFHYLVGVAGIAACIAAVITGAGFAVWYCRKKCKSSATSQDQQGPVRFSVGSGSISPTIHTPFPRLISSGAPHLISNDEDDPLMEENSED
ncbi:PREDICTED: uncharacterized protein LOC106928614 [Poecilia mexicana]|uniref:uncharacterized protein LOC106928614 n=1 Tax=Poecilia mexicana TaxID=48701 RepID=UPI00072E6DF4|nr:PREDICTED: uncharacterized protein LOC106928614 [Poecilia mexicana]XP_014860465.1 PREDICTED: uncharacterized protein LOC106928614 [Poecilia mexicana]